MKKTFKFVAFMTLVLVALLVGAYQRFVVTDYNYRGDAKQISDVFAGNISITGSDNQLTIRAGSEVPQVTLLGSSNVITIEDGADVAVVQGIGNENVVIAPQGVDVDLDRLKGQGNARRQSNLDSLDGL